MDVWKGAAQTVRTHLWREPHHARGMSLLRAIFVPSKHTTPHSFDAFCRVCDGAVYNRRLLTLVSLPSNTFVWHKACASPPLETQTFCCSKIPYHATKFLWSLSFRPPCSVALVTVCSNKRYHDFFRPTRGYYYVINFYFEKNDPYTL